MQTVSCEAHTSLNSELKWGFLVTSPTGLRQLLAVTTRRDGARIICSDGSGGFCVNGGTLVTIGTPAVRLIQDTKKEVRSSLGAVCCLHLGGERKRPHLFSLCVLRDLSWRLFRRNHAIDWGCSDHAKTFFSAHLFFKKCPSVCDSPDQHRANSVSTEEAGIDRSVVRNLPAIVTQLSEEDIEVNNQRPPLWNRKRFLKLRSARTRTLKRH